MPIRPELLEQDIAAIKRRRKDAVRYGNETIPTEYIPLDSPTMMRVTGGGIPIGRITRFWGDPSTGKTHMAYLAIAAAQRYRASRFPNGMECMYWNIEGIYDAYHAAHLGVDTKRLLLGESKVIEDIAVEMEVLLRSCHFHVIDSSTAAKARDALAADEDSWQIGLNARAWIRALDRLEARFDGDENVLIVISHVGEKIDIKRHTSYKYAKDGKRFNYVSSLSLEFSAGSWLYYHPDGHLEKADKIKEDVGVSPSGLKEADGIEVTVICRKNRTGRQGRAGKLRLDLNAFEFDTTFELLDGATFFDEQGEPAHRSGRRAIIQKTGERSSWYQLPDGTKVQGERGARRRLMEDQELAETVRRAMLAGW